MRKERKPIGRWIGEAILIFLSVLGAFYFDNLREQRNEKQLYIKYLKDFQSDLQLNQLKFEKELAFSLDIISGGDYLNGRVNTIEMIDSLQTVRSRANGTLLINALGDGSLSRTTRWIFQSPQYEKLISEYYSFIKNDTLKNRLSLHNRNYQNRHKLKNTLDAEIVYFDHNILNRIDFQQPNLASNQAIVFGPESVNQIDKIRGILIMLRDLTAFGQTNDNTLLNQVKIELELWGQ